MGGNEPSYNNVTIDTSTVRGYAERIFAEQRDNVKPNADLLVGKLGMGNRADNVEQTIGTSGVSYSGTWIAEYHENCVIQAKQLLDDVQTGLRALANAAASIAEDFDNTDEANADHVKAAFTADPPPPVSTNPTPGRGPNMAV